MSQHSAALFELSRQALGTTQAELGEMLGISRRTAQRWASAGVPSYEMRKLAQLVHAKDPKLAAQIAASVGTTLEAIGIVRPVPAAPPPAPRPSPDGVVDAVVCAAAEAMELMPRDVRPALHAAFARAGEIGLTVDDVERALRAKLRPAPTPATPAADKRSSATASRRASSTR
jgi:hypothetical protein